MRRITMIYLGCYYKLEIIHQHSYEFFYILSLEVRFQKNRDSPTAIFVCSIRCANLYFVCDTEKSYLATCGLPFFIRFRWFAVICVHLFENVDISFFKNRPFQFEGRREAVIIDVESLKQDIDFKL